MGCQCHLLRYPHCTGRQGSEQGLLLPNSLPKLCQHDLTQTFAKSSTPNHCEADSEQVPERTYLKTDLAPRTWNTLGQTLSS